MEENILPKRNIPRDLFLHLLAIVTLYWSAVSFVTLLWQYINKAFPDVLSYYSALNEPMRFAIASLIIVFPIFLLVSRYLNKIYAKEAVVRESKIRKWLIYFTLFITAIVIIVDLVTVINTFLNGELKIRFILKALSVLVVAAAVFWYYLDDVRRETPTKLARPFAIICGAIILIGVVGAFFVVGSPATARLGQLDQQKIYDLQNIQSQIVNYWQSKEKLPVTLAELEDPISGFKIPADPQTGTAYEYVVKNASDLSFELCANFNLNNFSAGNGGKLIPAPGYTNYEDYNQNWLHGQGKKCFERTIDKQLYPVKKQ